MPFDEQALERLKKNPHEKLYALGAIASIVALYVIYKSRQAAGGGGTIGPSGGTSTGGTPPAANAPLPTVVLQLTRNLSRAFNAQAAYQAGGSTVSGSSGSGGGIFSGFGFKLGGGGSSSNQSGSQYGTSSAWDVGGTNSDILGVDASITNATPQILAAVGADIASIGGTFEQNFEAQQQAQAQLINRSGKAS